LHLLRLIHSQLGTTGNTALSLCYTLEFTLTEALGLSALTSRILATNLSQSHCHYKSHMKSSFHSLIPFLPLFCNCQFRGLGSIQFLCSQVHILAGWCLETRLSTFSTTQSQSQSQNYFTTGGLQPISSSWRQAP
jgi:hypothetical protein